MSSICKQCAHLGQDYRTKGEVMCLKAAFYTQNDGYGYFNTGARCIQDDSLRNLFEPKTGEEDHVTSLSEKNRLLEEKTARQRDKIKELERRLTLVNKDETD